MGNSNAGLNPVLIYLFLSCTKLGEEVFLLLVELTFHSQWLLIICLQRFILWIVLPNANFSCKFLF